MRCDVNVSVRPKGEQRLRTRVEIKNMNSLTSMQKAIEFETARQVLLCCADLLCLYCCPACLLQSGQRHSARALQVSLLCRSSS